MSRRDYGLKHRADGVTEFGYQADGAWVMLANGDWWSMLSRLGEQDADWTEVTELDPGTRVRIWSARHLEWETGVAWGVPRNIDFTDATVVGKTTHWAKPAYVVQPDREPGQKHRPPPVHLFPLTDVWTTLPKRGNTK